MGVLPHQTPAAFDCASGNKHSKTALVKVRTRGCLQVKHSVSIHCVKHTKSKHCVQTITKYNQWLNFYRRRALGNSPRPTLSIYCPAARKYLLVWFAKLIRACVLWQSIAHIVQDASWHKRSKNALCKVRTFILSQTPVQFKHCVCNYSVNTAL